MLGSSLSSGSSSLFRSQDDRQVPLAPRRAQLWKGQAEGVGFEPTVGMRPQRFSRPPDSATLASLRLQASGATIDFGQGRSVRKNSSSRVPHSWASTPLTTSGSWFKRGSAQRL